MLFLYKEVLYLTLIPMLFFLFSFFYKDKDMNRIFSKSVLEKLSLSHHSISTFTQYRLFLIMMILLIIALARPVFKDETVQKEEIVTSLVVALDISKSMKENDIYPNRLTLARQKLDFLVQHSPKMNLGVILFAQEAYSVYPMSDDIETLAYMLKHIDFEQKLGLGSNIFGALEASVSILKQYKSKNILLLSDGGNSPDMQEESAYLKKHKLNLFAVDISSMGSSSLENLALTCRGYYKKFSLGHDDIKSVMKKIKEHSVKEQAKEYQVKGYTELFMYPLSLALFLLFFVFNTRLEFKSTLKSLFFVLLINFSSTSAHAGLLDFYYLNKAQTLYEDKKYQESVEAYKKTSMNDEVLYNIANALYKAEDYSGAIQKYKTILGHKTDNKSKILHNIANSYVQLDKLQVAKSYYEKSLKVKENRASRENLQEVINALNNMKRAKPSMKLPKLRIKIAIDEINMDAPPDSKYTIKVDNLVYTQEQIWMKLLQNRHSPSFLHKIPTTRRSLNASKAW